MANTNSTLDLTTPAGRKALRKSLGRRLQRSDFPTDTKGWQSFCDYRIGLEARSHARATRNLEYWKRVREGEHLTNAVAKLDAVTDLQKQLDEAKAQLAAANAKLASTKS